MDVWIYFHRKEVEFRRFGLVPERERYAATDASRGAEGRLHVVLRLAENAYLRVYEQIEVIDRRYPRRVAYAYVLVIDGAHAHSWEFDPSHDAMPVHEHVGPLRLRRKAAPITLEQVLRESWELLSPA
jgi:hypothetical protein